MRTVFLGLSLIVLQAANGQVSIGDSPRTRRALTSATDSTILLADGPNIGQGSFKLNDEAIFKTIDSFYFAFEVPVVSLGDFREETSPNVGLGLTFAFGTSTARTPVGRAGVPASQPLFDRPLGNRAAFKLDTFSGRVGLELPVSPTSWLTLTPRFAVAYNHIVAQPHGNVVDRVILKRDFGRVLTNWRSDSLTYIPELRATWEIDLAPLTIRTTLVGAYLETRTFSASTRLQRIRSRSLLGVFLLAFDWRTGWAPLGMELSLVPRLRYSRVEGDAVAGLGTRDMLSIELQILLDTSAYFPVSGRLGIETGYFLGVDLEGWTLGVTFEF